LPGLVHDEAGRKGYRPRRRVPGSSQPATTATNITP
jgi:hypothetical protein